MCVLGNNRPHEVRGPTVWHATQVFIDRMSMYGDNIRPIHIGDTVCPKCWNRHYGRPLKRVVTSPPLVECNIPSNDANTHLMKDYTI